MYKTCSKLPQVLRGRTYSPMEEEGVPSARSPMNSPGTETSNGSVAHSSSRKNVRCPTCNGIGWVRKEEEGQLVALIPLNDQRLKPRRTVVYVLLAVALCLVTGGLCCFFLYPRDVRLDSNRPLLQPPIVNFTDTAVVFRVTNYFNLTNDNFYPTPIKSMSVSAMMYKKQLASNKWRGNTKVKREVPSRSRLSLPINITFRFSKKTEPNLVEMCENESPWVHNLYMSFVVNIVYSALGRTQEVSGSFLQRVICHPPMYLLPNQTAYSPR